MAYLAKGKKQDLIELVETLGVVIEENFRIPEISNAIITSPTYDAEFTKECLNRIINDRKEMETAQRAEREKENERLFELEKLKLQSSITASSLESQKVSSSANAEMPKLELNKLIPNFDPKTSDMSLFLDLFERQLTLLKVPVSNWVIYLVGLLPTDVAKLIAKESSDDAQDYQKIKQILLKRFKLMFTPVYHPQANPVERKNRDLKPRLAILVGDKHHSWAEKLPTIRFAMNTHKCETTGQTAAFLQFGRELRTPDDVTHDLRHVISNDNFVAEITPYLKRFASTVNQVKELVEKKQDYRKQYADASRRPGHQFKPGDRVWISKHPVSKSAEQKTSKFMPRRDGPYVIMTQRSPTTYEVSNLSDPHTSLGVYHSSALRPCFDSNSTPLQPLRRRGRPRKHTPGSSSGRCRSQRGRM
ncbi:hypothetical protein X975_19850, partial [Stegodyphus mimosarum]